LKQVRRIIGWCAALAVLTGLLTLPTEQASADPVPNAAAKYVINVPGDVLAGAAGTSTQAAQLAAGQTFNWDFAESQFSQVSGAFTATPVDPASVLTTTDLATFGADAASFTAPAIAAARVAKVVGGASLPLLAFEIGAKIGEADARAFGFKDDQVCAQRDTAMTIMAGVLDGVDCSGFNNALATAQRNLDNHKTTYPDTCIDTVGCWSFVQQEVVGPGALYNVFKGPCIHENVLYSTNHGTTDADFNHLTGLWPDGCPNLEFPSDATPAITAFFFSDSGAAKQSGVSVAKNSGANPQRSWQCIVTTTTGQTYEQDSAAWTEADPIVAPIQCKGVPAGQIASRLQIIEHGGGADQTVFDQLTSGAYRDWLSKFPECANGSCPILLHQLDQSCFIQGIGCDGWIDDPQRDKNYSCTWGTHPIPLNECFPYGNVFNPADQANGFVYSDPSTGGPVTVQTAPTTVDEIETSLLSQKWVQTRDYPIVDPANRPDLARRIAAACVAQIQEKNDILIVKLDPEKVCSSTPTYSPGIDVLQASQHDQNAISAGQPFVLHYETRSQKVKGSPGVAGVRPGWYGDPETKCQGKFRPVTDPPRTNCDEYPFFSTTEGGPIPGASLLNINYQDNQTQGRQLGQFYSACSISGSPIPTIQNEYLVAPIPDSPSVGVCG
jgi:hypothetical protein